MQDSLSGLADKSVRRTPAALVFGVGAGTILCQGSVAGESFTALAGSGTHLHLGEPHLFSRLHPEAGVTPWK